ncbi:hypothetical protein [Flavihumibacter fluvii]|uniref:hypothetical protein n=1 Tax=Flavihumibacter fluvii TaxID=2838157 RepID=UPI001BDE7F08|nr:hypothetical protein [Flavihumibacter fluvii]ULQ51779.1 hypothetical protein KJS93_16955 [Flavihumibacter fluvii]
MANPHKFYLAHMNAKTGYRATWDPGRPLKIGFIGKLDKFGVFTVFSSLDKEGLIPEVLTDTSDSEMDYTSENEVNIGTKLAGKAPAVGSVLTDAEAGFVIDFKSEKGVVFKANGYKTHQVTNLGEIEKFILPKFKQGNWEKDWLIVTQLVEASSATIIISNSSNGKLELKASAGVGAANLKLTDASLGLTVARETGSTLKFIAQEGLTPLYRLMGIRHPLFGKPGLRTKGIQEGMDKEEFQLQDFDPGEVEQ